MTALKKRILCLLLAVCLCVFAAGCDGSKVSGYREIGTIEGQELCIAFRQGDQLRDIVTAGMMVMSADGTIAQLSTKWFGETDTASCPADAEMAGWLQNWPHRVLTVGYYPGAQPMCYEYGGVVQGFDADMFANLCARLGWELRFQPIARGSAEIELASGNVDCVAGGFGTTEESSKMSYSPTYLTTKYSFVAKAGGDISRTGQLKGKTLATVSSSAMGKALEGDEKLMEKLGQLMVLGSEADCFTALDAGKCDAILVSSLCADAHMK